MAVAFVDKLEPVQIEHQQRGRATGATGVRNGLQRTVAKQSAIRQIGERIVVGVVLQARLVGLSLAHVACDRRKELDGPVRPVVCDGYL